MNAIRDPASGRSWVTLRELIDFIESTHHAYLRLSLPLLDRLSNQIAFQHVAPRGLMDRLQREFTALADLLETHLARQDRLLFPKIRHLREPVGETAWACQLENSLEELIDRAIRENHEALSSVDRVQHCLRDPAWSNSGPLVAQFIEDLVELRENFENHVHLETDVMFPAVQELFRAQVLVV